MKTRASPTALALFCALAAATLRGEVEFSGYMRTARGEMRFVLADPAAKKNSGWLGAGENFDGYVVTAFDLPAETLTIVRDGVTTRLPLKAQGLRTGAAAGSMTNGSIAVGALLHEQKIDILEQKFAGLRAEIERRRMQAALTGRADAAPSPVDAALVQEMDATRAALLLAREEKLKAERRREPGTQNSIAPSKP